VLYDAKLCYYGLYLAEYTKAYVQLSFQIAASIWWRRRTARMSMNCLDPTLSAQKRYALSYMSKSLKSLASYCTKPNVFSTWHTMLTVRQTNKNILFSAMQLLIDVTHLYFLFATHDCSIDYLSGPTRVTDRKDFNLKRKEADFWSLFIRR
jgi:hypothetical protein